MGKQFSEEQKRAIESINGHILVVSCPGSGKTTVIMERIKKMVESGINPTSMLNITFTKAAAEEMEARFQKICNEKVKFSTIHSFCWNLLSREKGLSKENILKESEKYYYIGQYLIASKKVSPDEMEKAVQLIMSAISYCKNKEIPAILYNPDDYPDLFHEIAEKYEQYKSSIEKYDFDDMIILCRDLLKNDANIRRKYQSIYKYITVDEFQDVNSIQADICQLLTGEHGNLFVVGDDDQSIYRFRAADSSIMLNFPQQYPDCKTIYMGTNYRSGKKIVYYAGKLIEHNENRFKKDFKAFRQEEGTIIVKAFENDTEQAKYIVSQIEKRYTAGQSCDDIAILYRNNNLAVPVIMLLMKKEIPFCTAEPPKSHHGYIYEDIMAYYRLSRKIARKGDIQRILNKPSRYIKAEPFQRCGNSLKDMLAVVDTIPFESRIRVKKNIIEMFNNIKSLEKIENPKQFIYFLSDFMEYKEWLKEYAIYRGKNVEDELNILKTLVSEAEQFDTIEEWICYVQKYEEKMQIITKDKSKKGVCLSTYHSSKGLEWDTVYAINTNNGITPYCKAETMDDFEEERRMFYVAITRAKNTLVISYTDGIGTEDSPSPYLSEMGFIKQMQGTGNSSRKLDVEKGLGK